MGVPLKHLPAAATAAVITISAITGVAHEIEAVLWSYDAAPTGGNLKIESPSGTTLLSVDVTSAGVGFLPFSGSCIKGASGEALIITLASGAGAVVGKVNAIQRK